MVYLVGALSICICREISTFSFVYFNFVSQGIVLKRKVFQFFFFQSVQQQLSCELFLRL
jgi:hypothetical protein